MGEADRLETRLREVGVDPTSVRTHVFTHLHVDHVGAGCLPGATAVVHEHEWRAASRPGARLRGYIRAGIDDPQTASGDHDLYGDGTIRLLATPGHTAGHQSVLVTPTEGPPILVTGDAVYSEAALLERRNDGVGVNPKQARASIDRLRALCRETPMVVAPTHDAGSAARIAGGRRTDDRPGRRGHAGGLEGLLPRRVLAPAHDLAVPHRVDDAVDELGRHTH